MVLKNLGAGQETDWKKVSRPSGTYRNIMEDLTFVSSESQRERRKDGGAEKGTEEIMADVEFQSEPKGLRIR